mgnify:CR=1 FL=1
MKEKIINKFKKIKKGKIVMTVTIAIACFALTLVMTMQFKIVNETDITSIDNMRESELRTELANWKSKYEDADKQYQETISKINEYQKTKESNDETNKVMDSELQQVNMGLGKTDIEGKGIIITIKDSTDTSDENDTEQKTVSASNLLIIVNALKLAGAEAISINDQRIINMSDIVDIGSVDASFIKVNGQRILSPYVIKAIGDPTYMESSLIGNGGAIDTMKKTGQDVTIDKPNNIKIQKYNGEIKTKYIQ